MRAAALLLLALGVPLPAAAQVVHSPAITAGTDEPLVRPADAKLVWSDEFDVDGLPDPKRWAYDTARNKQGWHNEEKQYYANARPQNVRVEGGRLIITATAERLADKPDPGGQGFAPTKCVNNGIAGWR